jgi:predicted transcriptional regulator
MSDEKDNTENSSQLLDLTAKIVSAYAANVTLTLAELTDVISSVSGALSQLATGGEVTPPAEQAPAVPVKKSVSADFIICLEDGKKLKMLKRHLKSTYGMTPAEYRTKWNLPRDYPMVAPNYAAIRSQLAKKIGLGKVPAKPPVPVKAATGAAKRGRPKKLPTPQ